MVFFLPWDHGLDFFTSAYYFVGIQSTNQPINQSIQVPRVLLSLFWYPCMAINNVSVQYYDGFLPVIIIVDHITTETLLVTVKSFYFVLTYSLPAY